MPRVTVILPTHNRADVVAHALQSVLDQTETDFELFVIADGCTDATLEVIGKFRDPRIRLFDLPKAPHFGYANRNVALREAKGDKIAFVAHDDLVFPDHLALLIRALEDTGREWAYSRPLWVSTDGVIVPFATNLTNRDELSLFLSKDNALPSTCVMYRRECVKKYGYFPENVPAAADWHYWVSIIEGGGQENVAYMPTPTCLHFSANWRASRYSGVPEVRLWLEIADSSGWWPAALRYDIPTDKPEQAVIADAMQKGGTVWAENVRLAAANVIDRVAWDDLRKIRPRLRHQEDNLTASLTELGRLHAACAEAEKTLTACCDTLRHDLGATSRVVSALRAALNKVCKIRGLSSELSQTEAGPLKVATQTFTSESDLPPNSGSKAT